jgi:hypothetical protein
MIATFEYKLRTNKVFEAKLEWIRNRCADLYNACIQERGEAYKLNKVSIAICTVSGY